ncbi:MAG: hypothetical protein DRI71_09040 [Bacteroidetes bacterium]|nr:MAG: hypothetical protein DRI71_09040 [Bacteroidota bacterium]
MAMGAIGILIIGLLYFIKKDKERGVLSLTTSAWCLYLISVVKFLPQKYFLIAAVIMTVITVLYLVKKKKLVRLQTFAGGLIFLTAITMVAQPQDERYYLLNIKYNYHIEQDYWAWDKYSWFLYLDGKKEEAQQANDRAMSIVIKSGDEAMKKLIADHQAKLKSNDWHRFK